MNQTLMLCIALVLGMAVGAVIAMSIHRDDNQRLRRLDQALRDLSCRHGNWNAIAPMLWYLSMASHGGNMLEARRTLDEQVRNLRTEPVEGPIIP